MAALIGISGGKGSGKSTLADLFERHANDLWPTYRVDGEGRKPARRVLTQVHRLPLAEPIKSICVDLLGLDPALVYGTDEQKQTPTRYRWGQMPHYARLRQEYARASELDLAAAPVPPFDQLMTVRQVMQEVGSGWFRAIDPDIWIRRWRRRALDLYAADPRCVVIADDVRFENEIEGMKAEGAFLVRLTRGVRGDSHESERDLDGHAGFDFLCDNRELSPMATFHQVVAAMVARGFVDKFDAGVALFRAGFRVDGQGVPVVLS